MNLKYTFAENMNPSPITLPHVKFYVSFYFSLHQRPCLHCPNQKMVVFLTPINHDKGGRRGKWKLLVPSIQLRHLLRSRHPVHRCRRHLQKPRHRRPRVSQLPYRLACLGMAPIYSLPYPMSSFMSLFISLCTNVPVSIRGLNKNKKRLIHVVLNALLCMAVYSSLLASNKVSFRPLSATRSTAALHLIQVISVVFSYVYLESNSLQAGQCGSLCRSHNAPNLGINFSLNFKERTI